MSHFLRSGWFGLVWCVGGLTTQQQPGSYQGGEMMMMKCQFHWWRKPEYPEETTDLPQVTDETFTHTFTYNIFSNVDSQKCVCVEGGGAFFWKVKCFERLVISPLNSAVHYIYTTQLCSEKWGQTIRWPPLSKVGAMTHITPVGTSMILCHFCICSYLWYTSVVPTRLFFIIIICFSILNSETRLLH